MSENKKSKTSWVIDIVLILLVGTLVVGNLKSVKWEDIDGRPMADEGQYDYCVQWGGLIERSRVMAECLSEERDISCDFQGYDFLVYNRSNGDLIAVHKCTGYAKTLTVTYDQPSYFPELETNETTDIIDETEELIPIDELIEDEKEESGGV